MGATICVLESTFIASSDSSGAACFVVPLIAAIGFGIPVPTEGDCSLVDGTEPVFVVAVSGLRPTCTCNLACGILCIFVGGGESTATLIPLWLSPDVLRLIWLLSFLVLVAAFAAGTFDVVFAGFDASHFFELFVLDVDVVCDDGMFESLLRLMLESLLSLLADEKPELELVRFDSCVFGISVLSLPKSFSLPSIDCFAGVCWFCCSTFPFVSSEPLYGLAGIFDDLWKQEREKVGNQWLMDS